MRHLTKNKQLAEDIARDLRCCGVSNARVQKVVAYEVVKGPRAHPVCTCGHVFTLRDVGIDGDGPEDRVIFSCPDCHGITEMDRQDVTL
jgi:hypothetical protein